METMDNPISNYDVQLRTKLFSNLLGVTKATLVKLETGDNPLFSPIRIGNSKNQNLRQKYYKIPDIIKGLERFNKRPNINRKGLKIAIWNNKGGVGKSTAAQHLGAYFSGLLGLRTLLIDTDSQSDLTMLMGAEQKFKEDELYENFELQPTIRDVIGWDESDGKGGWIRRKVDIHDAIIQLSPTLFIIPSDSDVGDLDADLYVVDQAEEDRDPTTGRYLTRFNQVHKIIEPFKDEFDIILFDCGPNTGLLNLNVLWTCDILVIPVEIEAKCLHSLKRISERLKTYAQLHDGFNFESVLAVPNKFRNEKLKERALGRLRELYGNILSNTTLKLSACIDKCANSKEPIFMHATSGKKDPRALVIAEDFWKVAHEILGLPEPNNLFTASDAS